MQADSHHTLPWQALLHTAGGIPWPALEQFAKTLVADPSVFRNLHELYHDFMSRPYRRSGYECLYVPAILALAAPRLGPYARRNIGEFLVEALLAAAGRDDQLMIDALRDACRAIPPADLPAEAPKDLAAEPARAPRQWLPAAWKRLGALYAGRGRAEGDPGGKRAVELARRFARSPAAGRLPAPLRRQAGRIAEALLDYAWGYESAPPERLDENALRDVLLEQFPRHLVGDRAFFEKVAPVTRALLGWLESEGILPGAAALAEAVGQWADRIVENAMDPAYWGLTKSLSMPGRQVAAHAAQGPGEPEVTPLTPSGETAGTYTSGLVGTPPAGAPADEFVQESPALSPGVPEADFLGQIQPLAPARPPGARPAGPPAGARPGPPPAPPRSRRVTTPSRLVPPEKVQPVDPIVRASPKVGRNDPCPCGSGKKYKKCCGRR